MGEIFFIKNFFIPDATTGCSTIIPVAVSEGSFLAFFPESSSISFSSLGLFEEVGAKYGLNSKVDDDEVGTMVGSPKLDRGWTVLAFDGGRGTEANRQF